MRKGMGEDGAGGRGLPGYMATAAPVGGSALTASVCCQVTVRLTHSSLRSSPLATPRGSEIIRDQIRTISAASGGF